MDSCGSRMVTPEIIQALEHALVQHALGDGELGPVVDALDLVGVGGRVGVDAASLAADHFHHVGQEVLLLGPPSR